MDNPRLENTSGIMVSTGIKRYGSLARLDLHDRGLTGKNGGETIVHALRKFKSVKHLILGNNDLGDEGIEAIMDYLCSPDGLKLGIEEISLNSTGFGDRGLDCISRYLIGNEILVGLHLQHNLIRGSEFSTAGFVKAINSSFLRSLNLTNNTALSDHFLACFLPSLTSTKLRELKLSCLSLTAASGTVITAYLSSSASIPLRALKLNGNHLDIECMSSFRRILHIRNFSLTCLEMFANHIEPGIQREENNLAIMGSLVRNLDLAKCTTQEALGILPIARVLLLPRGIAEPPASAPISLRTPRNAGRSSSVWPTTALLPSARETHFPFRDLPTEIQLQILAHLTPTLSAAQRVRIYKWTSDPSTLPSLKLGLAFPSSRRVACVGDPTATMMSGLSCSGDPKTCLGPGKSLICGREEKRNWWLEYVGCERYEIDPSYYNNLGDAA